MSDEKSDYHIPEERAVISMAVVLDGALSPPLGTWEGTPYALIGRQFHDVVAALLAARTEKIGATKK